MKRLILLSLLASLAAAHADPQLTSWFTANSGQYARIYASAADETAGTKSVTWSRGTTSQATPAYSDVSEIASSTSWIYIRTTGLASHMMGPWPANFPGFPSNTATGANPVYRIPRVPALPATKVKTGLGVIGRFVNGVSFFDNRDAFSYVNSTNTEANPGDAIWSRDAYVNESATFDKALAHQAGNNYHYHVHPVALRAQLGDHVNYIASTNTYTEAVTAPAHSPIIAWAADGFPVYGPYGYSEPTNASSGVRRMVSGYTLRNGSNGTANLTTAGRHTLPAWAAVAQNNRSTTLLSTEYGPDVSASFPLGRYIEDNDYLGDLGFTQTTGARVRDFDLDQYNGRTCVTPDFPTPHYCYFTTINADGTPAYPYNIGRQYYGNPTGGAISVATMTGDSGYAQYFIGGANTPITIGTPSVSAPNVTLTWSAVEGGTYSVDASSASNFSTFTNKASGLVATGISKSSTYATLGSSGTEYGRVNRTALATYDATGQTAATVAQTAMTSYPVTPNTPPTISAISAVTTMKNSATTAIAFTVGDPETAVASLTVSATSSNTTLVPNANITFGGSGANRSVTVTPASGQIGTATITITVSDGTTTTSTTFTITVKPPNILLIIADDLGLDTLSVYSSLLGNSGTGQFPPTSTIASLAANGVQFNRAYTYTVCSPSRACILTGRFGYRTGVGNVVASASNNFLQQTEFTLPRAFALNSSLDYQLKHFGKWHLTAISGTNAGLGPCTIGGWPAFTGTLAGQLSDYYNWTKINSDGTAGGTTSTALTNAYETTDLVTDAVNFITTQTTAGKPWFTTVSFNAPHITQALPWYQLPPLGLITAPYTALSGTSADILANPRNYFDATIQAMDTELGRLLASVDLTKTNVIFIGDNGTYGSNAPNSGSVVQSPFSANKAKATLYEGGIRVPLIIRGPDVVSPGRTTDALTHFVDLYSTILEMAGINVASTVAAAGATIDSHSLLPVLQNTSSTQSSLIYGEEFDIASPTLGGRCLRDSQYKLIRKAAGTDEFYDLTADPYEATNLIAGGTGSLTAPQLTAYNNLVTQLGTFNTAPTISTVADQSTQPSTATGAIAFTVGDAELSPTSLTVTTASSNTTLVPSENVVLGGSGANRTVTITPATGLTSTSTITLNVTDGAFTTSTSFVLTVAVSGPPTISAISTSPTTPTNTDTVTVSASVQPIGGRTLPTGNVVLTYTAGTSATNTVFTETMGASAGTWTTAANLGTNNAWTINFAQPQPNGPYTQTTAANHGAGNAYGMEMNRGTPNLTDNYITTTNATNATGTSAYVEFYIATASLINSGGWAFQTSTDNASWTTRLSETTASNHAYQLYHYDLTQNERVSTLRLRFQFAGAGAANPASKISLDDMKVVVTTTATPVIVAMTGPSGGGTFSAQIPAQAAGTPVTYFITATDSATGVTTSATNSYTVGTAAPVLAVTPATTLASSGAVGSGVFTPSGIVYTLTNTGTGTMNWTASKSQPWLNLSSTSGTLAAGASTTVTASISTANANALSANTYNDTITFTNTTNNTGNTMRAASLTIGSSTAPGAPALATIPAFSQGTAKMVSWNSIPGALNYTLQISTVPDFATVLSSQTVTSPGASFGNLTHGVTYYYRAFASNAIGSSGYSNVVSSTQDNVAPAVAITSPSGPQTTATNSITLTGTSSDALSGISKVTVNGATATTSNNFATWTITVPLGFGTNSLTALAIDNAGNTTSSTPLLVTLITAQTYNPLVIPDLITGTTFNLTLKPQTKQFFSGAATNTNAYNEMLYGAPTLIMNKGDWVQMNVTNSLSTNPADITNDAFTTTTHWHGFHIPAIMDGGPHQTIPATTAWSPSWTVMNNAGTYWYHPHLHLKTQEQVSRGAVGMIIIRDTEEAALALPRSYGVDDIPLALGSRRFTTNQIVTVNSAYGDTMLVNGVVNPQVSLPKQYVRLRILNAEIERSLNLGFSDNRTFWVIATDGGLMDSPVATTRLLMGVGERYEILADLSNDTIGGSIDLKAYNSSTSLGTPLANSFPGGEPATTGQFGSLLNNVDFNVLRINIAAQTASPILARPATLTTNALWTNADVTNPTTRTLNITGGAPGLFFFNTDQLYTPNVFNQTINFNAVERWTITNTSGFSHSFHIHDIQFALISRVSAGAGPASVTGIAPYEVGWKDTLYVQRNSSVTFIAKFDHFASGTNPFMYHCHFANHEDEGLMGQFAVVNNAVENLAVTAFTRTSNNSVVTLQFNATPGTTYTLQCSPDLSGTWTDVGSVTSDGTNASFNETDPTRLGQARGFYRVKIPTVP